MPSTEVSYRSNTPQPKDYSKEEPRLASSLNIYVYGAGEQKLPFCGIATEDTVKYHTEDSFENKN
jgi:hypothetical protein